MSNTANVAELCARIDSLIQEHMATTHRAVAETLRRSFSVAQTVPRRDASRRSAPTYRSKEVLDRLQETLYHRLQAHPGVGAAELATSLQVKTKDLSRPLEKLKQRGLIRCVGLRSAARYFPVAANAQPTAS